MPLHVCQSSENACGVSKTIDLVPEEKGKLVVYAKLFKEIIL